MLLEVGVQRHANGYTTVVYNDASNYSAGGVQSSQPTRDYMPMRYSLQIKPLRKKAKLTQQELAERVGVEQPTVQRWEAGKQQPDLTYLDKLATVLGVHPGELFRDDEMERDQEATEAALQQLVAAAVRGVPDNVPASTVRPIARGLTRGLELLLRNPAIRTNPDALAVAVQVIESQAPDASSPS